MDETIIPYGIFRKQQSDFKELMIELTSISLKLDEACYLDIVVYNPNNFGIKNSSGHAQHQCEGHSK